MMWFIITFERQLRHAINNRSLYGGESFYTELLIIQSLNFESSLSPIGIGRRSKIAPKTGCRAESTCSQPSREYARLIAIYKRHIQVSALPNAGTRSEKKRMRERKSIYVCAAAWQAINRSSQDIEHVCAALLLRIVKIAFARTERRRNCHRQQVHFYISLAPRLFPLAHTR